MNSKDKQVMFDSLLPSSRGPAFWQVGQERRFFFPASICGVLQTEQGMFLSSRGPAFWQCGQVDLVKKQPATHCIINIKRD